MSFADKIRLAAKPVGGRSDEQRSPGVRVDAIDPTPEGRPEVLLPYRGTEQHGVDVTGVTRVSDEREPFRSNVDVEVVQGNEPADPVLVRVVQEDGSEVREWRAVSTVIDATARMILTRMPTRTVARITNEGAAAIRIGTDPSLNSMNSFPIAAGATLADIRTTEEIYAISADGSSCAVSAMIEYRR